MMSRLLKSSRIRLNSRVLSKARKKQTPIRPSTKIAYQPSSTHKMVTRKLTLLAKPDSIPQKNISTELCSELSDEDIQKTLVPLSATKNKITDISDFNILVDRLLDKGIPGLYGINTKIDTPYIKGHPSPPNSMLYWYRGHQYTARDLVPSVHQFEEKPYNAYFAENEVTLGYYLDHRKELANTKYLTDVLAYMQHYGAPSRLLDHSTNPATAGVFACLPHPKYNDKDGIIWVLNPFMLNAATTLGPQNMGVALPYSFDANYRARLAVCDSYETLKEKIHVDAFLGLGNSPKLMTPDDVIKFIDSTMTDLELRERMRSSTAIDVGNLFDRVARQDGRFTLSGGKQYYDRDKIEGNTFDPPLSLFQQIQRIHKKHNYQAPFLACVLIDKYSKPKILSQLATHLGKTYETMMGSEDSRGETLRKFYKFRR